VDHCARLRGRMGYEMAYESSEAILRKSTVTPSYAGITYERIEAKAFTGPARTGASGHADPAHRSSSPRAKGMFHAIDYIPPAEQIDAEYPLYLTTGRVLYQYHTGTMTMKSEGLNERAPESFVEIARQDAITHGLEDGQMVTVASRRGRSRPGQGLGQGGAGTVFLPFHYAAGGRQPAHQRRPGPVLQRSAMSQPVL
jgi:formate dehydrogenase major subunit